MKTSILSTAASLVLVTSSPGQVLWDESVDGDFSDAYLNPNLLALSLGTQRVLGSVSAQGTPDRDLFTLEVPAGAELTALRLLNYGSLDAGNISFVGVQQGTTLSQAPSSNFSDAIGYALFAIDDIGRDLLPTITGNPFIPPFNGLNPLPAGEYALWVNETATTANYEFEFEVLAASAVPEPSITLFVLFGAFLLSGGRKRK